MQFTSTEIKEVLEKHQGWLNSEDGGCRADLCDANLRGANLCRADLRGADLCGADLRNADLCGANLCGANLRGADLCGADLCGADLCGANLHDANLCGADLCGANLRDANLCGAQYDEPIWYADIYYLLKMQKKLKLRAWKYLVDGKSPYQHTPYKVGEVYTFSDLDTDAHEECGKGGNIATLNWCLKDNLQADEFIEVEFSTLDIVVPYFSNGKFRVKEFKVLRQINRKEAIELIKGLEVNNGV